MGAPAYEAMSLGFMVAKRHHTALHVGFYHELPRWQHRTPPRPQYQPRGRMNPRLQRADKSRKGSKGEQQVGCGDGSIMRPAP